ncbi:hypothetical protein TYRP_001058 [Tyrophagus putrescentiae]|nr:hypothetical protein TYRP_001058 [Tyrophagus putrescentiae]
MFITFFLLQSLQSATVSKPISPGAGKTLPLKATPPTAQLAPVADRNFGALPPMTADNDANGARFLNELTNSGGVHHGEVDPVEYDLKIAKELAMENRQQLLPAAGGRRFSFKPDDAEDDRRPAAAELAGAEGGIFHARNKPKKKKKGKSKKKRGSSGGGLDDGDSLSTKEDSISEKDEVSHKHKKTHTITRASTVLAMRVRVKVAAVNSTRQTASLSHCLTMTSSEEKEEEEEDKDEEASECVQCGDDNSDEGENESQQASQAKSRHLSSPAVSRLEKSIHPEPHPQPGLLQQQPPQQPKETVYYVFKSTIADLERQQAQVLKETVASQLPQQHQFQAKQVKVKQQQPIAAQESKTAVVVTPSTQHSTNSQPVSPPSPESTVLYQASSLKDNSSTAAEPEPVQNSCRPSIAPKGVLDAMVRQTVKAKESTSKAHPTKPILRKRSLQESKSSSWLSSPSGKAESSQSSNSKSNSNSSTSANNSNTRTLKRVNFSRKMQVRYIKSK